MLLAALNISSETATHELSRLLVDFVVVADYFLLDTECHVTVLERLRSCLSGGGTRRRWPEFVEAVEYAYGLHLADSETPRLMDARKVLVSDLVVLATLSSTQNVFIVPGSARGMRKPPLLVKN